MSSAVTGQSEMQLAERLDSGAYLFTKVGRGWRLADPLEGLKRHFRREKGDEKPKSKYDLADKDMDAIMELVHKRATSQAQGCLSVRARISISPTSRRDPACAPDASRRGSGEAAAQAGRRAQPKMARPGPDRRRAACGTFVKRRVLEMHTISAPDCVQNARHIL